MEGCFTVSACDIEVAQTLEHEAGPSQRWALWDDRPPLSPQDPLQPPRQLTAHLFTNTLFREVSLILL